jgi:ribose 5-phosphate isomerase B
MKILIASDHAGFETKQKVIAKYKQQFTFVDMGPSTDERTDYPDFADKVVRELLKNPSDTFGVLICGSGQGMAMRANKYQDIRAALCWNGESAKLSRAHNDANILCLGGRLLDFATLCEAFESFVGATFEGGRHADRVKKVSSPV